ncbi:LPXTG cell wall anchor domain-containing protein [Streptomyces sp. NPDC003691]
MKLRRAAAVAAASAVLAPLALLSAPAALATGVSDPAASTTTGNPGTPATDPEKEPGTGSTEGGTAGDTEPGKGEDGAAGDGKTDGGKTDGESAGQDGQQPAEPGKEGDKEPGKPGEGEGEGGKPGEPGTNPGNGNGQPPVKPGEGEEGGEEGEEECATETESKDLKTTLRGLPSKVVAGSGWQNFTYRVANDSDRALESVTTYLLVEAYTGDDFDEIIKYVTLQAKYGGTWQDVDIDAAYLGDTDQLKAGEYAELELRLKVDGKAPAGTAFLMTLGVQYDEKNNCIIGLPMDYEFAILAAGSKPGGGGDAEGKPGKGKPNKPGKPGSGNGSEPQGGRKDVPVTGNLAATGSSDALPVIGVVGGVAVLAGAGVVFALKRRRGDATA